MHSTILLLSLITQSPDRDEIFAVARRGRQDILNCYRHVKPLPADMSSKVVTSWTIDVDGSVSRVTIERSTGEVTALDFCIRKVIKQWKFAKPADGKPFDVSFPWTIVLPAD